jgi:hypothetical protein
MKKSFLYFLSIFIIGCTVNQNTIELQGTTYIDNLLKKDTLNVIRKDLLNGKCQQIDNIIVKSSTYKSHQYRILESMKDEWTITTCNKSYLATITFFRTQHTKASLTKTYFTIDYTNLTKEKPLVKTIEHNKTIEKKQRYYSLEEAKYKYYKEIYQSDKEYSPIVFTKYSINVLETKNLKHEDYYVELKPILLNKSHKYFYELLQDKTFFDTHKIQSYSLSNLEYLIYHKNKAIVTFSHSDKYSFARNYYLLTLNNSSIKILRYSSESACGGLVEPIPITHRSRGQFGIPMRR